MIYIVNFKQFLYFHKSEAKPKNVLVFAFEYVSESLALFYRDFGMNSYGVEIYGVKKLSSEVMKR